MTLCIAAICQDGEETAVVLALDRRVETSTTSSENETKMETLTDDWLALLAGNDLAQARELAQCYYTFLKDKANTLTYDNAVEELRSPANEMRRRLADNYTQKIVSMSYADFLKKGKSKLPDFIHQDIVSQVAQQRIEAEIILAGWLEDVNEMALFEYDGLYHRLVRQLDFATVGSGSTIAQVSLFQRGQSSARDLNKTLYHVYEAEKDARAAPGVGEFFELAVLRRKDGECDLQWLTEEASERLEVLYNRLERGFVPDEIDLPKEPFSAERWLGTILRS